jgi:hypothetical protein
MHARWLCEGLDASERNRLFEYISWRDRPGEMSIATINANIIAKIISYSVLEQSGKEKSLA